MPPELPETIGPYRVQELLGRAGQSAVYKALDRKGRPVAVKLFPARLAEDTATAERFHREIQAFTPVSRHPHLVHILETGQEGDRLYLVMELVEGTSLDRVLKQGRLPLSRAFAVMRDICQGLAHAHRHGLVHRGLTPRNVLVSPDFSTVKVGDFAATGYESVANLTATMSTGEIRLGALYYLAPETVDGRGSLDARADIYSAGVIFHEMLTGRPPGPKFAMPTQINPELTADVDMVVLRCIARRPEERYDSVAGLLAALGRLEEILRLRVFTEIRDISQKKQTFLYASLVLLALALVALGYWFLR
ncbi:MAG TPA: serine/threonine-protein kinase [Thermoanaerobaculia bacterium]|nr:serine/threonine-protein kinase [Thermoanaerobaculia bacterium]